MNPTEQTPNEFETMDTLALLRLYHKTITRLNEMRDRDYRVHEVTNQIDEEWDKLIAKKTALQPILEQRGVKFVDGNINLKGSSPEIQDLVRNNKPE